MRHRFHTALLAVFVNLGAIACHGGCAAQRAQGPAHAAAPRLLARTRVPGRANPWLAGAPDGTPARRADRAPGQSPVQIDLPQATGCTELTFEASGGTSNDPGCPANCGPTDGRGMAEHEGGAENGIAAARIPMNTLVGVFLGLAVPAAGSEPEGLDFSKLGLDVPRLAPKLAQPFFIGDGQTSAGQRQRFVVPAGATRLFLGSMDGYTWSNNSGSFDVEVTRQPCSPASGSGARATGE